METFLRSIYVDDLSIGEVTDEVAYQFYVKFRPRLAAGGFNLRKFVTNSADLRNRIEENETRLHGVYPTSPTREEDASDRVNLKPTAVCDPTSKLVLEDEQSYVEMTLGDTQPDGKPVQNVLGVQWDFVGDQLKFGLSKVAKQASESIPTKRNIASTAAKFYDPIGFLSPVFVQFKQVIKSSYQVY